VKVSAVLSRVDDRWLAECEEVELAGEGATREQALDALRAALVDYFGRAEAVAPPSEPRHEAIEIVVVGGA
jgi:hypothetical protein